MAGKSSGPDAASFLSSFIASIMSVSENVMFVNSNSNSLLQNKTIHVYNGS